MTTEKRSWAIFTIVRDETYYLPKWYAYYAQFLADRDIHVVHHVPARDDAVVVSTDNVQVALPSTSTSAVVSPAIPLLTTTSNHIGSRDAAPATREPANSRDACCDFLRGKECSIYVENEKLFSSRWIRDTVKRYQELLLKRYEAVIFTDVDEIIAIHPDSGFSGLGQFMASFLADKRHTNWRVTAYSIIHMPDLGEPAMDFSRPILKQRMYWFRDEYYDKPLITKIPLDYVLGHHTASNMNKQRHPHVYMIHLHQFDFEWYMQRHRRWASDYQVSDEDRRNTFNSHYRLQDTEKLVFQYYHQLFSQERIEPTLIERWVRARLASVV